ncbi:MAG TPA: SRPBCC family protein [Thermoanaerobaculia bacterium]
MHWRAHLMKHVVVERRISASPEVCFDAARDLDLHVESLAHTGERAVAGDGERAVAGRTSGLIELGESVTWRGRHFGVMQHFTSKITAFDRPHHFRDEMQRGAFRTFVHDHFFTRDGDGTRMTDLLQFEAPLAILGRVAETFVLRAYLQRLLESRAAAIAAHVERRR